MSDAAVNPGSTPLSPGQLLAQKYRLNRLLGEGGMGSVWLAENVDIGRTVAIKFLLPRFANDAQMLTRFRLEARAAAAIGHPGIVDVLDLGQLPDGSAFIVMEQLRGETLGARLKRLGPLQLDAALWVFDRIADAIGAAHAAGVVHRDLKPDNLFLVAKPLPAVKVLDFGISKFKASDDLSLTRTGITLGTPLYMSPEQARGAKDVGPSTDLYSLGAIFYHALIGVPPFEGDSYNELLAKVLTETPEPIGKKRPDLPPPLQTLVDALLAKPIEGRPSIQQMRAVIADCYASQGLSKEVPAALANPPGLEEVPAKPAPSVLDDGGLGPTHAPRSPGPQPSSAEARPPSAPSAVPPLPTRRKRKTLVWIALAFGMSALFGLRGMLKNRGGDGEDGEDRGAKSPPKVLVGKPNTEASSNRRAKTVVEVSPSTAMITLVPGGPCTNPCPIEGDEGKELQLALSAQGYAPQTMRIVLGWQPKYRLALIPLPTKP